ncbi:cyclic di-GMP phosphodiesterase PdeB [Shewanella colwelliana]|uniref:putative bifunctional diguanylate cyclase/phosphodiesterase n=1 Tax=Shewanella colwelliana TaxID=23 RepID=UPI001BC5D41A|nr:EAL domain-containing protein [Shewanella colwelliana]GIU20486.1 cyclic di-GMP phosphodiesterase PdeB [Shewanella colwelliana]
MRISKKLVVFVVGFCLPAVFAVSSSLSLWFENRVSELKQASINAELVNIRRQINTDLRQLELLARGYGAPMSSLEDGARKNFSLAWQQTGVADHLSFFYFDRGQVIPFSPHIGTIHPFESLSLPASLFAFKQSKTGFILLEGQGYMVSVVPTSQSSAVALVRQVDSKLLSHYQVHDMLRSITLEAGIAASDTINKESGQLIEIAVPALVYGDALHLSVLFSDGIFADIEPQISSATYLVLGLSLLLLFIGYLWLRIGLVRPFKQLLAQLSRIDPTAKSYTPLTGNGCSELVVVADRVNELLARIFQQKERSKITLEAIVEVVILTDASAKVVYLNPQAERLLNISSEQAIGMPVSVLFKSDSSFNTQLLQFMQTASLEPLLSKIKFQSQQVQLMERSISNLRNPHNEVIGTVIVLRDITQEEVLKHQLRRRANYDSVTSLLNRSAFEERLPEFSKGVQTLSICYFDLEQFKLINDSCGHSAGDLMLKMVAKAIQSSLDDQVLLARLGGDEFGLAIKNSEVLQVAQQVKQIIDSVALQVLEHQGCHYRVGISAGIAIARAPYITATELLKDADIACIAAKRKGSNQLHFYDDKDKELIDQRNAPKWAVRIAQAIEHNELLLYYQPIKGISGNAHKKRMEILLRIQEPCGRILSPAQFIAAAERFKLMPEVDKEVIRKAFLWLSMHEELWHDHCLSINLSGNSLGAEGMVDYIEAQLRRFAIPSKCICFEITETSAIQNRNRAMEMLNLLRQQGFSFALDDFGSGFASYGYLRELPVNYVKIDGCFVKTLASNAKDYAIVNSIHDVCRVMGIETVAEFVENQDIIDRLESIGINYAQGYAIGRPQSLDTYTQRNIQQPERLLA